MAAFWFKQRHYDFLTEELDRTYKTIGRKKFSLPEAGVFGELSFIYPQSDFCAITWQYDADQPFELGFDDHDNFISLHYFLQKEWLSVIPVATATTIKIDAGKGQTALSILFEKDWVLDQFSRDNARTMMTELAINKKAIHFSLAEKETKAVRAVIDFVLQDQWNTILTRAALFMLLDNFRNHLLSFPAFRAGKRINQPMEKLELVLMDSIKSNLPPLKTLAKEVAMSESTLKRKFKQKYGIPMNEWFLSRKMELGAEWLKDTKKTVTIIAYELGYEKVSSFISTFRKFYHLTPGEWRKQVCES